MKFARNLSRNTVPEWASSYIDYKALKKLIKQEIQNENVNDEKDPAGFLFALDRNLEDVDHFYNKKFHDFSRRVKLLEDRFGGPVPPAQKYQEDIQGLLAALLEIRGQLRKLQWYGEVNRRGFIKITKKIDKKLPGHDIQNRYLPTKVYPAQFASNTELSECMQLINRWLSLLGDHKSEDASSELSTLSLSISKSKSMLNISQELLARIDAALAKDDRPQLLEVIPALQAAQDDSSAPILPKTFKGLLQRAIECRSRDCMSLLLTKIDNLDEEDDINHRNCIHRLVISIGRTQSTGGGDDPSLSNSPVMESIADTAAHYITPATAPSLFTADHQLKNSSDSATFLQRDHHAVLVLSSLLDNLQPHQRAAVIAKDISGRTPLHYAAKYGFRCVCEIIIEHLQTWDMFPVSEGLDGANWQDIEGWTPLHLSVASGHLHTTKALLASENWKGLATTGHNEGEQINGSGSGLRKDTSKIGPMLVLATTMNFVDIVKLLVDVGFNINYQDEHGETALHIAARFGHDECARVIIEGSPAQKANLELTEVNYAWTPLFIACVDGSIGVVKLLIEAGASLDQFDSSGWTAVEHAVLRGHIEIGKVLLEASAAAKEKQQQKVIDGNSTKDASLTSAAATAANPSPAPAPAPTVISKQPALTERKSNAKPLNPIKTFGHRYLTDKSMILVSLGTTDMRKLLPPVSLDRIPISSAHSTQLDTALSIVVSATGAEGEAEVYDLPIHENIATEPLCFYAKDISKVQLKFDLIPTYSGSKDKIVGRGVALLSSIRPKVGTNRITLQDDLTVPLISANTLDVIGSVSFNFLVVTPFAHPKMSVTEDQTYWKSTSTMLIGHRGLGKNINSRKSLQLGENTVQSFIAAANLGASYVEFDVQLTKDHVPVIYHDFLVSETGIDAPVHTLTLEQFLKLGNPTNTAHGRHSPGDVVRPDRASPKPDGNGFRPRSMSVSGLGGGRGGSGDNDEEALDERILHTRDFKTKGFKGNTRGHHIQAPFATLEELFKKIPKSAGFNIELKYPMLHESENEDMDTYAVEANSFVDCVLTKIYDHGEGRNIIMSSFNPDICVLMSLKQPSIPVLFLTEGGTEPVGDVRASSLQEAIRFASRWNLLGIVSDVKPFLMCARLVRVVKESGLVCVSYGTQNNDPEKVKVQVREGIDAVIADSVLAIRQGLTETEGAHHTANNNNNNTATTTTTTTTDITTTRTTTSTADETTTTMVED